LLNEPKVYRATNRFPIFSFPTYSGLAFSALTLQVSRLNGKKDIRPEWLGAGVVICLERGADLHMAQLMPVPLTVSCFSEIQIGFTILVPARPGSPGKRAVKRVCARACVCVCSSGVGYASTPVRSILLSVFVIHQ